MVNINCHKTSTKTFILAIEVILHMFIVYQFLEYCGACKCKYIVNDLIKDSIVPIWEYINLLPEVSLKILGN